MSRSAGHCMTMGTASTMACLVEALGHRDADERRDSRRRRPPITRWRTWSATASSRWSTRTCACRTILTREAFENAIRAVNAVGGSTNAVIHLLAIRRTRRRRVHARRLGPAGPRRAVPRRPDAVGQLPDGGLLLRRRPAGGPARTRRPRASRRAHGHRPDDGRAHRGCALLQPGGDPPARPTPLVPDSGIAVLRGNLAPDGAIIKPAAASAAPAAAHRARDRRSRTSTTSTRASTTRRSTSTRPASSC